MGSVHPHNLRIVGLAYTGFFDWSFQAALEGIEVLRNAEGAWERQGGNMK